MDVNEAETQAQRAHDDLYRAETAAYLAQRPGLAYAATRLDCTVYLVTYNGEEIGELRHASTTSALDEWYGHEIHNPDQRLGPFHTSRQAAAALLATISIEDR